MRIISLLALLMICRTTLFAQVGINNINPDQSASVDITSTNKGLLIPRMTQNQRNLISNPATGLMIYQSDGTAGLYINNGTSATPSWTIVGPALSGTTNSLLKLTAGNTGVSSQISDNGTAIGVFTTPVNGYPFFMASASPTMMAVFTNSNAGGKVLVATNTAAAGTDFGSGLVGYTAQASNSAAGVVGSNYNTNGTGVIGTGNNITTSVLGTGSGGAFTGLTTGVYANNTTSGVSQALYANNASSIVRVDYWNGTTLYKINGSGTVSTNVKGNGNEHVTLHAPETPEIYFQDFGSGNLLNGRAHIQLDPLFAKNVTINAKHPMRVFVQPEGDCKGVYVTNKTATGFDVVELAGGSSSIGFQWTITCNRADEDLPNGRISRNADMRFELHAGPEPVLGDSKVEKLR